MSTSEILWVLGMYIFLALWIYSLHRKVIKLEHEVRKRRLVL